MRKKQNERFPQPAVPNDLSMTTLGSCGFNTPMGAKPSAQAKHLSGTLRMVCRPTQGKYLPTCGTTSAGGHFLGTFVRPRGPRRIGGAPPNPPVPGGPVHLSSRKRMRLLTSGTSWRGGECWTCWRAGRGSPRQGAAPSPAAAPSCRGRRPRRHCPRPPWPPLYCPPRP